MSEPRWYHLRDRHREYVCCVPGCAAPLEDWHPTPTCHTCGLMIADHYRDLIVDQYETAQRQRVADREATKPIEERWEGWHVVYYLRIGDYIKIGTTKRLKRRVRQLRASFDDLLAIEEGDHLLEARRHRQFVGDRIDARRENFRPSEALLEHVADLGGRDTLPTWARLPDTTRIAIRSADAIEGVL